MTCLKLPEDPVGGLNLWKQLQDGFVTEESILQSIWWEDMEKRNQWATKMGDTSFRLPCNKAARAIMTCSMKAKGIFVGSTDRTTTVSVRLEHDVR